MVRSCSLAVIERLRLRRLEWGDSGHEAALAREFGCFDLIVGADVVYVEEALPRLLASSAALLRRDPAVRHHMCHSQESLVMCAPWRHSRLDSLHLLLANTSGI